MSKVPDYTKPHPKSKKDPQGLCKHCGLKWNKIHICPRGFYDAHYEDANIEELLNANRGRRF